MHSFLDLPTELITLVLYHVDRPSLKSLRQISRTVHQVTNAKLFHTVRLFPDDQSCDRLEGLLANPQLRQLPKKIYINTIENDLDSEVASQAAEAEWPQRWNTLIPRLKEFDDVQSAVLRFDQNYGAEAEVMDDSFPQTPAFRFRALDQFFSMIASLKLPLKELGIRNLQVDNPRNEKTREILANVLPSLDTLRLAVVSEHGEADAEGDIERPELHKFYQEFPSTWLAPAANSLRHLSLSGKEYFGFYPNLVLRGLHFPHLKSLSLSMYTFSDDTQVDWIISHAATLEELFLDDCAILYDVAIVESSLSRCAISKEETEFRRNDSLYTEHQHFRAWDRRWHHLFATLAEKLPNLRRFVIGSSGSDLPLFENEKEIQIGLFINRYMACYDGYASTPYLEYPDLLDEGEQDRPECDEEDREALRMLLRKLGQTVEETYSMGYRVDVKELIQKGKY